MMARLKRLENEQWVGISGYEEFYEISDQGRVKSRFRYARSGAGMRRVPEKLMTQTVHPQTGHCRVQLSKKGKIKTMIVYKLVMEAYGKPKPDGYDIKHKDGNRQNNALSNLEWTIVHGSNSGEKHSKATLNDQDIEEIRAMRQAGIPVDQIATKMQISKSQVSKVASRKSRSDI
jgi:hypothetical protein